MTGGSFSFDIEIQIRRQSILQNHPCPFNPHTKHPCFAIGVYQLQQRKTSISKHTSQANILDCIMNKTIHSHPTITRNILARHELKIDNNGNFYLHSTLTTTILFFYQIKRTIYLHQTLRHTTNSHAIVNSRHTSLSTSQYQQ